ncbi:MAG: PilZ domain-containing protein [Acidobacteria bacterium]|nr:PilZ domain-containing protein [Acidobacteriota bacterium]
MAPDMTSKDRHLDRVPTNTPVTLLVDPEGQKLRHRARLLDISESGMRLKTRAELAKGQLVEVFSEHGLQEAERTRVVWVSDAGSEQAYVVGLEFLNPHPVSPVDPRSATLTGPVTTGSGQKQPVSDTRWVVGDDRGPMAKR